MERAILWMMERLFQEGSTFQTPSYMLDFYDPSTGLSENHVITRAKTIEYSLAEVRAAASQKTLYVSLSIQHYPLGVVASFDSPHLPDDWPKDTPWIFLDLNPTLGMFNQTITTFVEALEDYLRNRVIARSWQFHPRESAKREAFWALVEAERSKQRPTINTRNPAPDTVRQRERDRVDLMVKVIKRLHEAGHKTLYECQRCLISTSNNSDPCLYCGYNQWATRNLDTGQIQQLWYHLDSQGYGRQSIRNAPILNTEKSR